MPHFCLVNQTALSGPVDPFDVDEDDAEASFNVNLHTHTHTPVAHLHISPLQHSSSTLKKILS